MKHHSMSSRHQLTMSANLQLATSERFYKGRSMLSEVWNPPKAAAALQGLGQGRLPKGDGDASLILKVCQVYGMTEAVPSLPSQHLQTKPVRCRKASRASEFLTSPNHQDKRNQH